MPHKYLRIAKTYAILFLMRSKERQYIIENMARQSTREIAEALGIKERKVRKFLEKSRESRKGKNRVDRVGRPTRSTYAVDLRGRTGLWIHILLIAILGFTVYSNSLDGKFIWDDRYLIKENVYVKNPSRIDKIFTESIGHGAGIKSNSYRPLQMLTYMAEYATWNLNVRGYHLTNIILHILAAISLYWLITILFNSTHIALLTGILFVVHPIHTEAVAYISGRADPLAFAFMIMALIFYIKSTSPKNILFVALMSISYILALLSRENSLMLPVLILIYHLTFPRRDRGIIRLGTCLSILFGISFVYLILRTHFIKAAIPHLLSDTTVLERIPGFFVAIVEYIRLLFLPFNLHMEYGDRIFSVFSPLVITGVVIALSALFFAVKMRKSNPLVFFSVFWFFIALLPVSNLYPATAYMAEHWLYLPSLGFFLLLAYVIDFVWRKPGNRPLARVFAVGLIAFYSILTIKQNVYWKEPIPFYTRTLKYAPDSYRVYNDLGIEYYGMGRKEEAITQYEEAIKLDPEPARAYSNLGVAYRELGRNKEAIEAYKKAIEIDSGLAEAYNNLGVAYEDIGGKKQAKDSYGKAVAINPYLAEAHSNLGNIYSSEVNYEDAIRCYNKAIKADPHYGNTYNNLANVYKARGNYKEAISLYQKAIERDAKPLAAVHNNLALAYLLAKQHDLAIKHYDKAGQLGHELNPQILRELEPYR